MRRVGDRAGPVQLIGSVQLGEQDLVELVPDTRDTRGGPVTQPPPAGHARAIAKLLWELVPADPGREDEQDAVQAGAIVERQPARPALAALPRWQQWLDPFPELIGDLEPIHGPWRPPRRSTEALILTDQAGRLIVK